MKWYNRCDINTVSVYYKLFWLSEKWISLSQVIRGKGNQKLGQGLMSMCLGSLIKIFGAKDLQLQHKTCYLTSRNWWRDVQHGYRTILEHFCTTWFDSGNICNFKIISILAGLMIAHTSLFYANSNKNK